jgi:hypothetical protein
MTGIDISPAVAVRAIAAHSAGRTALVYEDRPVSFTELAAASAKLAGLLAHSGIGLGDRVAYLGLNSPAFFMSCLASAWLRAVFVADQPSPDSARGAPDPGGLTGRGDRRRGRASRYRRGGSGGAVAAAPAGRR